MATTTTNFGFIKPELNDNVSPTPYNENFDKLDEEIFGLKIDYVVSYGTEGNWTYRKWASGIAEIWGTVSAAKNNNNVAGGSYTLPMTLTTVHSVIATVGNGKFNNAYNSLGINVKAWSANGSSVQAWVHSRDGSLGTYNPVPVSIEVRGMWKE